MTCFR